jgi:Xaa-Pro aminopeptidase
MDAGGRTARDEDRLTRVREAISANRWDALICTLPSNVRLLSGYWPVIGSAVAIATREGAVAVLAPEGEEILAERGWADVVLTFRPGSLDAVASTLECVREPLSELLTSLKLQRATVAFEDGAAFAPASYASTFVFGASTGPLLRSVLPLATLRDGTSCLAGLRSVLSAREQGLVRRACAIARSAFEFTAGRLHVGTREYEVAALLRTQLADPSGESRADGFAWCMSGPHAARAYLAFQQTTSRQIEPGDCVLIHCNSYCDGFWTDITRTFRMGASGENRETAAAILAAADCARAAVRPGIPASTVDRAAREVMTSRGMSAAFKHATGHGVGFAAIDHNALPRIHPHSPDCLCAGMIFNIEPGAYFDGKAGIRHCEMVLVTDTGAEILTPFQNTVEDLTAA